MSKSKRPRLTLMEARSSRTADLVDRLVDAPNTTAGSIIRQLPREQLDLALLHIVSSVDERWRVRKPLPLPASDEETEIARRKIADWLAEHPEAIVPASLALGDAVKAWDPRPRLDIRDTPHTPPADAA